MLFSNEVGENDYPEEDDDVDEGDDDEGDVSANQLLRSCYDLHFMIAISRRVLNGNKELFFKIKTSSSSSKKSDIDVHRHNVLAMK